jgi:arabinan endo-1,5-alpha-L-arabinosidase
MEHHAESTKKKGGHMQFHFNGAVAVALLAATLGTSLAGAQGAVNPLNGDLGVHDPVMIKAGNTYYVFATGIGVAVKTSTDRITWKNAGSAFSTMPAWQKEAVPGSGNSLWAPDISFRDGKYWLYYSISTFGSRVSAIGLATATSLEPASGATRWENQGLVVSTTNASNHNAIDPNVVVAADGTPWLAYGSFWTGIKMIKLDRTTGKPAAGAELQSLADHPKGGIEGAFVIRRGAYYYQFVSWDRCCAGVNSTYNIRVGRSAIVTGPYADSKGVAMLNSGGDLIDRGDERWKGPGHNGIFVENDTVFLVNHAYDAQKNGASILWIRPLYWTPDGWPTLDKSAGTALSIQPLSPAPLAPNLEVPILFDTRGRKLPDGQDRRIQPAFPLPAARK